MVGGNNRRRESDISGLPNSPNRQASNTGITGSYRQVSPERAGSIIKTYKSIPGGITLEGEIVLSPRARTASYEAAANAIILNNDIVYLSPVSGPELAEILLAIAADSSMGVSLSSDSSIVYGRLVSQGRVAMNLKLADKFLGGITFAEHERLTGYRFAPGYEGRRPSNANGNLAVYFNLQDFQLTEDPSGEIKRSAAGLDITLVPLTAEKGQDGGHVPDYERIKRGDVPSEYVANATHIQDNLDYYGRERIVRVAFAYGEAAAFARTIKSHGISSLEQLARAIDPASTVAPAPTVAQPVSHRQALPADLAAPRKPAPQKKKEARQKTAKAAAPRGGRWRKLKHMAAWCANISRPPSRWAWTTATV